MDAAKVKELLELIDKASVPPPNTDQDQVRYDEIVARNEAIIDQAEMQIDAELAV